MRPSPRSTQDLTPADSKAGVPHRAAQGRARGDANGDGTREAQEDEFIEFVNLGGSLDLSGYSVHDNAQERHVFPQGTIIPSGGILVLFGGGNV